MQSSNDVKEFIKNNINTTDEELNRIEKQLNDFAEVLPTSIMNNVSVKEVVEEGTNKEKMFLSVDFYNNLSLDKDKKYIGELFLPTFRSMMATNALLMFVPYILWSINGLDASVNNYIFWIHFIFFAVFVVLVNNLAYQIKTSILDFKNFFHEENKENAFIFVCVKEVLEEKGCYNISIRNISVNYHYIMFILFKSYEDKEISLKSIIKFNRLFFNVASNNLARNLANDLNRIIYNLFSWSVMLLVCYFQYGNPIYMFYKNGIYSIISILILFYAFWTISTKINRIKVFSGYYFYLTKNSLKLSKALL